MSTSYSGINASGDTRMHVGAHHDNSTTNTTYNTTNFSPSPPPQRPRGLFSSWSARRELRKRNIAFLKAVEEKQKHRSEALFQQGLDVDFVDERGFTALHWAAIVGYQVDYLLERGYDINAKSAKYGTPLCLAALEGNLAAASQLLAANAKVDLSGSCIPPALHAACSRGHVDVARVLIGAGASLDITAIWGPALRQPLRWLDADASLREREGTALLFAVAADSTDAAQLLLENGADANATAKYLDLYSGALSESDNMLGFAEIRDGGQMIRLLVRNGADPNTTLSFGEHTPMPLLMKAIYEDMLDLSKFLLTEGADASISDANHCSAAYCAVLILGAQSAPFVSDLLSYGASVHGDPAAPEQPIHAAARSGGLEVLELLVHHGADVAARTKSLGQTPLHLAASYGHNDAAQFLLGKGASIKARDRNGQTPVDNAERAGHQNVQKNLIREGIHPGHILSATWDPRLEPGYVLPGLRNLSPEPLHRRTLPSTKS